MNIGEYCPQQNILFHELASEISHTARDNIHNYYIDCHRLFYSMMSACNKLLYPTFFICTYNKF